MVFYILSLLLNYSIPFQYFNTHFHSYISLDYIFPNPRGHLILLIGFSPFLQSLLRIKIGSLCQRFHLYFWGFPAFMKAWIILLYLSVYHRAYWHVPTTIYDRTLLSLISLYCILYISSLDFTCSSSK